MSVSQGASQLSVRQKSSHCQQRVFRRRSIDFPEAVPEEKRQQYLSKNNYLI
jgi:hypothetical protein